MPHVLIRDLPWLELSGWWICFEENCQDDWCEDRTQGGGRTLVKVCGRYPRNNLLLLSWSCQTRNYWYMKVRFSLLLYIYLCPVNSFIRAATSNPQIRIVNCICICIVFVSFLYCILYLWICLNPVQTMRSQLKWTPGRQLVLYNIYLTIFILMFDISNQNLFLKFVCRRWGAKVKWTRGTQLVWDDIYLTIFMILILNHEIWY